MVGRRYKMAHSDGFHPGNCSNQECYPNPALDDMSLQPDKSKAEMRQFLPRKKDNRQRLANPNMEKKTHLNAVGYTTNANSV